jgi:hypothetical protein
MYLFVEDIESLLKCPGCEKTFEVPKLLPCGNKICQVCENEMKLIVNQPKQVKCMICKEKHVKPNGGFPVDVSLQKLISLKPVEIYRGEVHKKAQSTINKLNQSLGELNENLKNSNNKLNSYCDVLRTDINTHVDHKIGLLETYRQDLLMRINEYESKCQANIVDMNDEFKLFVECYRDCSIKTREWQEFIKGPCLSDTDIANLIETAEAFTQKVETSITDLENHLFDNMKVTFVETDRELQVEDIGKLVVVSIN